MTAISPRQLAGILAWYAEAGVDCAISDVPTDWLTRATPPLGAEAMAAIRARLEAGSGMPDGVLAQRTDLTGPSASRAGVAADGMAARQPAHTPAAHPSGAGLVRPTSETARPPLGRAGATTADEGPRRFPTASPDDAGVDARRQAARAVDLADLAAIVTAFEGCALKATAKSTCVYRGASQARLAVIGEAPGREEDHTGQPFVGRAGQLLDRMLAAIGMTEADVHITNIVYWRPPGNRPPTAHEALLCRPFLERQLELVDPDVVLALGGPATKALLGIEDGIMRVRGRWRTVILGGRERQLMPSLHPAYLLRTPAAKRQAWHDFVNVRLALNTSN